MRRLRGHGYREQALKLYPWVCGKCKREFTRENISELTVHHKDHNHDNNPGDGTIGSYCAFIVMIMSMQNIWMLMFQQPDATNELEREHGTGKPFANLKDLLKNK